MMSRWVEIIESHRTKYGFDSWRILPESHFPEIAEKCGPAEFREVRERLDDARAARENLDQEEPWNGDERDEVWRVIRLFEYILDHAD